MKLPEIKMNSQERINILVIGRHPEIMETVLRLIHQQGWHAAGVLTDTEAIDAFKSHTFDLVLMGGGVEEQSETQLRQQFERMHPGIKVIRHYGGGSGLLFAEVREALKISHNQIN